MSSPFVRRLYREHQASCLLRQTNDPEHPSVSRRHRGGAGSAPSPCAGGASGGSVTVGNLIGALGAVWFAVMLLCVLQSCRRTERTEAAPTEAWARGDVVVVEASAGDFYEARVVGVEGEALRIQRVDSGSSITLSADEVYRIPSHGSVETGQFIVCAPAPSRWVPCQVERLRGDRIDALTVDGQSIRVARDRTVVPSELTRLNLERRFVDAHRRARFLEAASRAGRPAFSPEWAPSPRERVIVRREDGWFSARVHEIKKKTVRVQWDADHRITEVSSATIAPEGPYPMTPVVGSFALARPASPAEAWELLRVHALVEQEEIVLEDARGERQTRPLRDVVPLGSAQGQNDDLIPRHL